MRTVSTGAAQSEDLDYAVCCVCVVAANLPDRYSSKGEINAYTTNPFPNIFFAVSLAHLLAAKIKHFIPADVSAVVSIVHSEYAKNTGL